MILITGGRGAVATALTALLLERGLPVRVGSADPSALTLPDGVPGVALNLADPTTFPAALDGVTSVFLYARAEGADAFAHAAHAAGVEHIVLLSSASVLVDDPQDNPLATAHLTVEQALLAGPVPVTILRPGAFAANAGGWARAIKAGQPVDLPYPDAYTEPVHDLDLAESALAALTDPAHRGGAFDLSGPASITLAEQVDLLGRELGRPTAFRTITAEQWKAQMARYMPGGYADALLELWRTAVGNPGEPADGVAHLTGHPARGFAQWAADHRADFEN
ncbi:MAG TPA: NAD(P)H-binding protein [Actinocrinis sp.]|nr:NAD(P)H-binding protein [Actinocrinis sp.]